MSFTSMKTAIRRHTAGKQAVMWIGYFILWMGYQAIRIPYMLVMLLSESILKQFIKKPPQALILLLGAMLAGGALALLFGGEEAQRLVGVLAALIFGIPVMLYALYKMFSGTWKPLKK